MRGEAASHASRNPRIAFIQRVPGGRFIDIDLAALQAAYEVDVIRYEGRPSTRYVLDSCRRAWRDDVTYSFFASEHALLPALVCALRRRQLVLAPAGYDFANVPEHRYGLAARGRGWLPKLLARSASAIICCSHAARDELLALAPSAEAKSFVAHLGSEPAEWADPGVERDASRAVTIAYVNAESWSRKGIDRFVAAANADPAREYVLGGAIDATANELLSNAAPPNLTITGPLGHDEMRRLLWSSGVYVQLSWHESFGMAVLEAMLCGCVPVISDVPALHEVANPWAELSGGVDDDLDAIRRATARRVDRDAMRADMANRFPAARRSAAVTECVARLLSGADAGRERHGDDTRQN